MCFRRGKTTPQLPSSSLPASQFPFPTTSSLPLCLCPHLCLWFSFAVSVSIPFSSHCVSLPLSLSCVSHPPHSLHTLNWFPGALQMRRHFPSQPRGTASFALWEKQWSKSVSLGVRRISLAPGPALPCASCVTWVKISDSPL